MSEQVWVVHCPSDLGDKVEGNGIIVIGWSQMGDLTPLSTRAQVKERFVEKFPDYSGPKVGIGAGILYRFVNQMNEGDLVLTPLKLTREILIGRISGGYRFDISLISPQMPNIRPVNWLKKISRDQLSSPFKNAVGGIMTVFSVDAHIAELTTLLGQDQPHIETRREEEEVEPIYFEDVSAKSAEMIVDYLTLIAPYDFQDLVAGILQAMGYKTQVSPPGPDGGTDISATSDHFGFQGPRITVQVKHRKGSAGAPEVQQLVGACGGNFGLFVSTGGFSAQANREADKHPNITLVDRDRLVELLLEHYDDMKPQFQSLVPLRKVYIPVPPAYTG